LLELVPFTVGLAHLVVGASRAVEAAGELAIDYGVSTFFVGVTVISVGTSIPEMTASVFAARYGAGDVVVTDVRGVLVASAYPLAVSLVVLGVVCVVRGIDHRAAVACLALYSPTFLLV